MVDLRSRFFARLMVSATCMVLGVAMAADLRSVAENEIVISSQNVRVDQEDVRAALLGATAEQSRNFKESPVALEGLASDLLLRRVLADRAKNEGLDKEPLIARRLNLAYEKALFELYMERVDKAAIDEKKIERLAKDEYAAYPENYKTDERKASHILVRVVPSRGDDAYAVAAKLLERLKAGEPFDVLAKQYSDDAGSASGGGDLGWLPRGKTVKPFEDALFALKKPGDLSDLVVSQFGIHIIKLDDLKPTSLTPFSEVKEKIAEGVRARLRQSARQAVFAPIKSPDVWVVDKEALGRVFRE